MHSEDAHASPEAAPDEWAGCVPPGYAVDCSPTMMTGVKCEPAWVRACLAAQSDGWRFCHNEAYCDRGELLFNMSPELYRIAHGPAAGREVKRGDGEWVVPAKCSGWELWWEGRWCALGHLNVNGINKTQTSMPGAYYRLPEVSEAPAPDLEGALSRGMSNALKQPAAPDGREAADVLLGQARAVAIREGRLATAKAIDALLATSEAPAPDAVVTCSQAEYDDLINIAAKYMDAQLAPAPDASPDDPEGTELSALMTREWQRGYKAGLAYNQPPAPDVVHVCSECGSLLAPGGDGIDYCWRCRVAPLRRSLRPAAPEVVYRTGDQWPGELIPIFQENDLSVFRELAAWKYTVTITREEKDHE